MITETTKSRVELLRERIKSLEGKRDLAELDVNTCKLRLAMAQSIANAIADALVRADSELEAALAQTKEFK